MYREQFQIYKDCVAELWMLVWGGSGPLAHAIRTSDALVRGLVQPHDLPDLMSGASGFSLPSRLEPGGVVIQEAAAAGLPLICSDACGASVHLLRDCFNGFTFPVGNAAALAERMARITLLDDEQRVAMAEHSFQRSRQYTPQRWVNVLFSGVQRFKIESRRR